MSLAYNSYSHDELVQSSLHKSELVYFIHYGGVAVCEPTCFSEPILVYGPGTIINLYQVLMDETLQFDYKALCPSAFNA